MSQSGCGGSGGTSTDHFRAPRVLMRRGGGGVMVVMGGGGGAAARLTANPAGCLRTRRMQSILCHALCSTRCAASSFFSHLLQVMPHMRLCKRNVESARLPRRDPGSVHCALRQFDYTLKTANLNIQRKGKACVAPPSGCACDFTDSSACMRLRKAKTRDAIAYWSVDHATTCVYI